MRAPLLSLALTACAPAALPAPTAPAPPTPRHHPIASCQPNLDALGSPHLVGHIFEAGRVRELVPGDSTIDDARCALGPYVSIFDTGNGASSVIWSSTYAGHSQMLMLSFDNAGRFIQIASMTSM